MNDMKILTDLLDKYNQRYEIVGDKVVGGDVFLYNKNLTTLPDSIGNLKCTDLYLDYNNLKILPESIGDVVCIGLHLSDNNLTYLPNSICNLECERLYLYNNNLTYLSKLNENIKVLSIDDFNDLTNLLYLPNLSQLWIDNKYFDKESLSELLNEIRHQKVMKDMNKILQTL